MDDFEKFYNKALRFLSFRQRSEKEVRDRLKVKSTIQNSKVIDEVIEKLKQQKYLNDEEFAKWWIEQRMTFKPRSLRLIKLELRQKGISDDVIESQMSDVKGQRLSDLEQAKELIKKRIGRFQNVAGMTREEIYQKLGPHLSRRGFDWETIKQSIDESFSR